MLDNNAAPIANDHIEYRSEERSSMVTARPRVIFFVLLAAAGAALGVAALRRFETVLPEQPAVEVGSTPFAETSKEPVTPLPFSLELDQRKIELGHRLFHEARLSGDGSISCAGCHNLGSGGVDRLPHSFGIGGRAGSVNAPTVFNSGFNFAQFWDGRAETLEQQVDGPLQNPAEMGGTWLAAIALLKNDSDYRSAFAAAYPDGVTPQNIRNAIATFERSLVTPNSRFDRFLRGDANALTENEREGYRLFKRIGCISCHQGANIGGNIYQKLGVMEDYFGARGHVTDVDNGRFNVTRREEDRYFFKVPTLRNVAMTSPYLHDGSVDNLNEVVRIMARYQLGVQLGKGEEDAIVAFLCTLTGEYQGKTVQ